MPEQTVPLNDVPAPIVRKDSFGSNSNLSLRSDGDENTTEFRVQALAPCQTKKVSLWHDISLIHIDEQTHEPTPYYNFVNEIPKFTRKKFEIATNEDFTPIKQDEKKGKLREFKKGDIFFNYGCFPQTWEDPTFIHPDAEGCRGDNDPLDVCEIGTRIIPCGGIRAVKVLGILCMIDEGEADWKVVVIDKDDKWAPFLNDVKDVQEQLPGTLDCIREWFRTYKIPDGKPPNVFGLNEEFMNKAYAKNIIDECHHAWEELVTGEKGRQIERSSDDDVAKLVRNLSKNSLFLLGEDNIKEHPEMRNDGFEEQEDVDVLMF
jgi:inorganic pyrophosphatase